MDDAQLSAVPDLSGVTLADTPALDGVLGRLVPDVAGLPVAAFNSSI